NCIIGGAHHPIEWVSTSPVFHSGKNIMRKNFYKHEFNPSKETSIGHDVWIGNNCTIRSGVNIGTGSVLGMGSVLTKDVGEYEIWAGNPAHLIRRRFSDDTITKLIDSEWWNWDDDAILERAVYFNNVEQFLSSK
ncbi:MAG TPA: CatB-related O-acetyltransferase, partial [Thermoclostridium sp.]|nr:CatB-related O-acetyltransferase [Thermoclostridium sp.]